VFNPRASEQAETSYLEELANLELADDMPDLE
jgi:hypothetical protein